MKDQREITILIAQAYLKDFSFLSQDIEKIAKVLESGIEIEKFIVATMNDEIVGTMAITDCESRAIYVDKVISKQVFGFLKGLIANKVFKQEFEQPLPYTSEVGYVEFVAVDQEVRKQGIATKMLEYAIALGDYQEYKLDVTDINVGAYHCYQKFGFKEERRIKEKFAKSKGFQERIIMTYSCSSMNESSNNKKVRVS